MTEEEKYEKRRAFAGERKPSMLRRCVGHDYTERRMYMVTMVTEGRRPLFGQVVGRSDGSAGSAEEPRMVLSPLGALRLRARGSATGGWTTGSTSPFTVPA